MSTNGNEDIDSKIADFMADIDEIVLGKKSSTTSGQSEWKECFDETTQAVYYWNTNTNECSWDRPSSPIIASENDQLNNKKRPPTTTDSKSPKKLKKPSLIAEYTSSESESSEEEEEESEANVDDIDELLEKVLDKEEKTDEKISSVDLYPLFEVDCRAAIGRLTNLGDQSKEILTLRVQLETRLEDCLTGHLSKSYAMTKLEEALLQIDQWEKIYLTAATAPIISEQSKPTLTSTEMALLLSLPPPPPPPSPPPLQNDSDQTLRLFYAQLNAEQPDSLSSVSDMERTSTVSKSEQNHHHHHKDKKSKPAKTLPTDLIQKWTHARQELRSSIPDVDDT